MSKQRDLVYDIIHASHTHLNAEEVFFEAKKRMPSIVLATVYNNLNALSDQQKIRRVHIKGEADRYDLGTPRHDHLICEKCGKIKDIETQDFIHEIEQDMNVEITSYDLVLHYLCEDCQNK